MSHPESGPSAGPPQAGPHPLGGSTGVPAGRGVDKKARTRRAFRCEGPSGLHAAFNHIAVSKALLINGMFMPKLLLAAFFPAVLTGLSEMLWAISVARSHDPCSWERATEKNRST